MAQIKWIHTTGYQVRLGYDETKYADLFVDSNGALTITPNTAGQFIHLAAADIRITALKRLYLDGGTDTYLVEAGADEIHFVAGGGNRFGVFAGGAFVPAGSSVYFDGGSDTRIVESAADQLDYVVGGSSRLRGTGGAPADGETSVWIYGNHGGTTILRRVVVGAADSGAAGFRMLRVAN